MLKSKFLLLCLVISIKLNAQTFLEVSPDFGFWNSNIANTKTHDKKAVIGNGLWKPSSGFSAIVNFGFPDDDLIYGIGFNFNISTKGSISESCSDCKIDIPAHSIGLFWQVNYNFLINTLFDFKMGFAIDKLETSSYYDGKLPQSESFPNLNNEADFKDSESLLIFSMGIKRHLFNDKFLISLDVTGDAGMSKINLHQGSFKTQTLGIKIGFGILLPYQKNSSWRIE